MNNNYNFNQPIRRLLRDFEDKKSGKVVESRREIRRRFDCLDRSHQVKFLMACFMSCKSDREWAYEEVTRHWDSRFKEVIANLWYSYHEVGATRCIVKHFPLEFVNQEVHKLDGDETYYDLCLRLRPHGNFHIDKGRLTPLQVLSIYAKTDCAATVVECATMEADVLEQLYRLLYNISNDKYLLFEKINRGVMPRCRDFSQCSKAFYFIMELQQYSVLGLWKNWNMRVQDLLCNTEEYHIVSNSAISDHEYNVRMSGLYKKCLLELLDGMSGFEYMRTGVGMADIEGCQQIVSMETTEDAETYNSFSGLNDDCNGSF